jgi:uncharacterized protein
MKKQTRALARRAQEAKPEQVNKNEMLYQMASLLASRSALAGQAGLQFGGKRDLYAAFGYLSNPQFSDYLAMYEHQGMATRIVEAFPAETWRRPPVLTDGDASSDNPSEVTPFLAAWNALDQRLGVIRNMRNVDTLCGIGTFAVLFLGAADASDFKGEVGMLGEKGLAYLATYDEGQTTITTYDQTKTSQRYGLPTAYSVKLDESGASTQVHYSRVIHVAENRLRSRIYGRPRLQTSLNRLFDVEKVVGGSAEAIWLLVYKGFVFMAQKDAVLPEPGTPEYTAMQEDIENYVHGLQRYLRLNGAEMKDLGSETVDPQGAYNVLISDLAGSLAIPKRILIGSEAGELASTQDDANWAAVIEDRQKNFAEPEILRPFVDWCILHGVLPKPKSGTYGVKWPSLFQLNDLEKSQLALNVSSAISQASGGAPETVMPPEVFAERYLGYTAPAGPAKPNPRNDGTPR